MTGEMIAKKGHVLSIIRSIKNDTTSKTQMLLVGYHDSTSDMYLSVYRNDDSNPKKELEG